MATITEKCIICEKPATMHIHSDAYCSECGKEMRLKILHHVFSI